jgi:Tissue inhibitor of metalloproteinase
MNLRLIVAASVVAVFSLAAHRSAAACSCVMPAPPLESMASSAAVFEGTVTGVREPGGEAGYQNIEVTLRIGRRFKGAAADTVTVVTANSSAACGYGFEQGRTYLVYADDGGDGQLSASLCSRTARIEDAAEDLAALGSGSAPGPGPSPEDPTPQPPPAAEPGKRGCGGCSTGAPVDGIAGLLLVMAAALALRRRA